MPRGSRKSHRAIREFSLKQVLNLKSRVTHLSKLQPGSCDACLDEIDIGGVIDDVGDAFSDAVDAIGDGLEAVGDVISDGVDAVGDGLEAVGEGIADVFDDIF
jgi:hypothetical protein